eukprot:11425078-Ditylum_brightwellii.AAC.1
MAAYFKGLHHAFEGWRRNQDDDNWKLTQAEMEAAMSEQDRTKVVEEYADLPPVLVNPVPRLVQDIETLMEITNSPMPPRCPIQQDKVTVAIYGFVDTSDLEYGRSIGLPDDLKFKHGDWGKDVDGTSSNYKELRNLVEIVEEESLAGVLKGTIFFLAIDNFVVESVYFKGTLSSCLLFKLVVHLKKMVLSGEFTLHLVYIPGAHMIAKGMDGLS